MKFVSAGSSTLHLMPFPPPFVALPAPLAGGSAVIGAGLRGHAGLRRYATVGCCSKGGADCEVEELFPQLLPTSPLLLPGPPPTHCGHHAGTLGIKDSPVKAFNGTPVRNLAQLAILVSACTEEYLRFDLEAANKVGGAVEWAWCGWVTQGGGDRGGGRVDLRASGLR